MAQTLAHLLTHTIFSTKNREPLGDLNPGRVPWAKLCRPCGPDVYRPSGPAQEMPT
jgi:hypothetical protein